MEVAHNHYATAQCVEQVMFGYTRVTNLYDAAQTKYEKSMEHSTGIELLLRNADNALWLSHSATWSLTQKQGVKGSHC